MKRFLVIIMAMVVAMGAFASLSACGGNDDVYKITFDANGGTVAVAEKTVNLNQTVGELPTPTREGFKFIQWVYERDGQDDVAFFPSTVFKFRSSITLTAVWQQIIKVTFDANGGTTDVTEKEIAKDSQFGSLPTPTLGGHVFSHWAYRKSGQADVVVTEFSICSYTENITLVAVYKRYVNIIFDANGGTLTGDDEITVLEGEKIGTLPTVSWQGYHFEKWVKETQSGDVEITANTKVEVGTEDFTVKALWNEKESYPITLNLDGGEVSVELKGTYKEDDADYTLPTPTRKHHNFLGWTSEDMTEPTKTVVIATGSTGAKEYTANWERVSYQVSLRLTDTVDGQEVTGTVVGQTTFVVSYGRTVSSYLGDATPPAGYDFIRWVYVDGTTETEIDEYTTFREGVFGTSDQIVLGAKYRRSIDNALYRVTLDLSHKITDKFVVTGRYDLDKTIAGDQHVFYVLQSGKTLDDYLDEVNDDSCDDSHYGFYRWVFVKSDGTRVPLAFADVFSADIFGTETDIVIAAEYQYTYTDWV